MCSPLLFPPIPLPIINFERVVEIVDNEVELALGEVTAVMGVMSLCSSMAFFFVQSLFLAWHLSSIIVPVFFVASTFPLHGFSYIGFITVILLIFFVVVLF